MVLMTLTPGISIITERIFESRFMHVSELARLGADIAIEGPSAIVKGGRPLSGAPVMASDLRASAALIIAGLAARGDTQVNRVYHIDRGYEKIDDKLRLLGARADHMRAVLDKLKDAGAGIERCGAGITIRRTGPVEAGGHHDPALLGFSHRRAGANDGADDVDAGHQHYHGADL